MPRKTPPVAKQVIDPRINTSAYLKARLIDFDTGSPDLEQQHKDWLFQKVSQAKGNSDYGLWVIGSASKLGDESRNQTLSNSRMSSVLKFMGTIDNRALTKVETWRALGSSWSSSSAADDNSPEERAVEVHIWIGSPPPDNPPPEIKPIPRPLPPLPGGKRYKNWSVATPGGAVANILPGVVIGFNIFVFKNKDTGDQKAYFSPQAGLGLSLSLKGGKMFSAVQTLLTSPSGTNMEFTDFTPNFPITWEELGDSLTTVSSVGAGAGVGIQTAHVTVEAPKVYHYSTAGTPIYASMQLASFNSPGKDFQVGAGGSAVTGPLILVGQ